MYFNCVQEARDSCAPLPSDKLSYCTLLDFFPILANLAAAFLLIAIISGVFAGADIFSLHRSMGPDSWLCHTCDSNRSLYQAVLNAYFFA